MQSGIELWLPLDVAAKQFGYAHKESLSRRLPSVAENKDLFAILDGRRWHIVTRGEKEDAAITIMWPNPKTALLRE